MKKRHKVTKETNIKKWKQGINNIKDVNVNYAKNQRGGIRF